MMEPQMIYLITGTNRGIGRAMVAELLMRPSTTVIGTVRDPIHETAVSLSGLPVAHGSQLFVIPLDDEIKERDYSTLNGRLQDLNIDHIDVVIGNAASSVAFRSILESDATSLKADFEANAVTVLKLFQVCWPRLAKSDVQDARRKKFILISSSVGSIGGLDEESFPITSYGMSKAAANWLAKKISVEFKEESLAVGIIHPGWVQTNMGQGLADAVGIAQPPMTVLESCSQVLKQIDNLSTHTTSGKFISFEGQEFPW